MLGVVCHCSSRTMRVDVGSFAIRWFGVVLYGTLAWKAPHDGNAKPGDVVMDAAGAEQALAVQVEQAQVCSPHKTNSTPPFNYM